MRIRKLHRLIGLVMLLPLFGWTTTGVVFFIKPGYGAAYELLPLRTYPLEKPLTVEPEPAWQEYRVLKTILGIHLVVRSQTGWRQHDPLSLALRTAPEADAIGQLVADAIAVNPRRYGTVTRVTGDTISTSRNVTITVDWNRLSLQQRGPDTALIDGLYRIHYLQWTGIPLFDQVLGVVGLAGILALGVAGALLAFPRRTSSSPAVPPN